MSINEEILRIKEVMGLINESFSNKDFIERSLNGLKWWLHSDDGLGFGGFIKNKLSEMGLKNPLRPDEIKKYTEGAQILKDNGKISEDEYERFVRSLPRRTLVFTNDDGVIDPNGKWNPINKLNTSYSDIADLISTILVSGEQDGNESTKEIINIINSKGDIKEVLLRNKENLKDLFNKYISSPQDIISFTKHTIKNSEYGKKIETDVADKLSGMEYDILYKGGNGDFIDMIFSTDMIVRSPKSGIRTIQVKSNESQAIKFKDEFNNKGKHQSVDLLIFPSNDQYIIHSLRFDRTKIIPKSLN